jgi:DNA-binding beta-propeller fold protein YncE
VDASNLTFLNNGDVFILGLSANNILKYDSTGAFRRVFASVNVGNGPQYIAFAPH